MDFPSVFTILVKASMPKTEIVRFDAAKKRYRMSVHAAPKKGKANIEIVKFFRKEYGMNVEIISGFTSKQKLLKKK